MDAEEGVIVRAPTGSASFSVSGTALSSQPAAKNNITPRAKRQISPKKYLFSMIQLKSIHNAI